MLKIETKCNRSPDCIRSFNSLPSPQNQEKDKQNEAVKGQHLLLLQNIRQSLKCELTQLMILAGVLRLILVPFFSASFNYVNWFRAEYVLLNDPSNFYAYTSYPPLFHFIFLPAYLVFRSTTLQAPFLYAAKLPLIVSDLVSAYLVYIVITYLTNDKTSALKGFILYAFNPFLIVVSAIWGEFDTISNLFVIIGFYYARCLKKFTKSALFLGLGIATKIYPVFLIPLYFLDYVRSLPNRSIRIIFGRFMRFLWVAMTPSIIFFSPFLILNHNLVFFGLRWSTEITWRDIGPFSLLLALVQSTGISSFVLYPVCQFASISGFVIIFILVNLNKIALEINHVLWFPLIFLYSSVLHENHIVWALPFVTIIYFYKKEYQFTYYSWIIPLIHFLIYNGQFLYRNGSTGLFELLYFLTGKAVIVFDYIPFPTLIREALIYAFFIFYGGYQIFRVATIELRHNI